MYPVTAYELTNTRAVDFRFKPGGTRSPSRRPVQPCTADAARTGTGQPVIAPAGCCLCSPPAARDQ
jgi:hypothetical protein